MINVASIRIGSVEELIRLDELLGECVFRGHGSREWQLESTLERTTKRWGVELTALREREEWLIREFQRRAHHYINDPPEASRLTEWTALLQHYGGPTRFLDVTRSLLVATFFAVENAKDDGIVWAFNKGSLSCPEDSK